MRLVSTLIALLAAAPAAAQSPAPSAAPSAGDAAATLRHIAAAYASAPAQRMGFVQTSSGPSYLRPLVQRGRLSLERPGSLRWEFQEPTPRSWISDGNRLWMVEHADRTVQIVEPVDPGVRRYLGLLGGLQLVQEQFAVAAGAAPDSLVLTPRDRADPVARIEVSATPEGLLRTVAVVDRFGDRTELELTGIERLPDLPDDAFRFEAPEGWTVVAGP